MAGGGSGLGKPLLAASAAFLAGAFFGCSASRDAALALGAGALVLALHARVRFAALGLALGLLRGASHEQPAAFTLPDEFEGTVVSDGVVRTAGGLVALRLRGLEVHRGDRALFFGRVREPPGKLNPGGRDRQALLATRGIALDGNAELVRVLARGPPLYRFIDRIRARFTERALLLCTSRERGALVAALGVGDRSALPAEAEEDLSASGLVHLLASSGLHLAVVVLLAREIARRIWLRTRWAHGVRASAVASLAALPFAAAEVLLLGAPWPAGLTTLAMAAAGCALVDPAATHDLALQLSVLGIAGLLLLARPLRDLAPIPFPAAGASLKRRFGEHMLMLACSTAAAALCTAPLLAASFHRVSLVSVAANALGLLPGLAAIPIATALVVVDVLPLWWLADLLSGATLSAAHGFAALPFATVRLAAPGLLACALWYAGVLLIARRSYRAALAPWAALLVFAGAGAALARTSDTMTLTFLAVGQGDSTIVRLPGGHAMLVDAGGDLRWPTRVDPGLRDVIPALAELGIARLDVVVLTHPHPDHAGGLLSVLDRIPIGELWMTREQDPIATAVREKARARGVPISEVRIEVPSRFIEGRSLNDNSIVLRLVYGEVSALLAGDVEALSESDLAQGGAPLSAALLKAPHHGSRTSSTDAFLRRVSPRATVYCTGAGNPFGFPHPEVVARTPGAHFSTADGAVVTETDGRELKVYRFQ
ncbi:MAG: MBL fold metallo-hydrolase [Deltaproteobacteria bacterium]|nr:MAG: MBL fold metallo-hydrolase [Deltaproteobacteria bacterium]